MKFIQKRYWVLLLLTTLFPLFSFSSESIDLMLITDNINIEAIKENNILLQIMIVVLIVAIFSYSARIIYERMVKKSS